MALTPADAFGRIELDYTAYSRPHVFRGWVTGFQQDSGVGTFDAVAVPASLDAMATELTAIIKGLYNTDSAILWGAWRGLRTSSPVTGAGVPIVEGTITPGTGTFDTQANMGKAVSQTTFSFRDTANHIVKYTFLGSVYYGPQPFLYSGLGGSFKTFVDYVLASTRFIGRSGFGVGSFIDVTFDTNDGLTRRVRR